MFADGATKTAKVLLDWGERLTIRASQVTPRWTQGCRTPLSLSKTHAVKPVTHAHTTMSSHSPDGGLTNKQMQPLQSAQQLQSSY